MFTAETLLNSHAAQQWVLCDWVKEVYIPLPVSFEEWCCVIAAASWSTATLLVPRKWLVLAHPPDSSARSSTAAVCTAATSMVCGKCGEEIGGQHMKATSNKGKSPGISPSVFTCSRSRWQADMAQARLILLSLLCVIVADYTGELMSKHNRWLHIHIMICRVVCNLGHVCKTELW